MYSILINSKILTLGHIIIIQKSVSKEKFFL
jgi:hypothetical protein